MVAWAERNGVEIWMDHQLPENFAQAYIISGSNTVVLNSAYDDKDLVSTLGHELLHIWQDHQGLMPHCFDEPSHYFIVMRLIEMSACALQAQIQDELKNLTPHNRQFTQESVGVSTFKRLPKSKIAKYYDGRFKTLLEKELFSLNRYRGRTGTFLSPRLKYDFNTKASPVIPRKTVSYVEKFGRLPNGENFLKGYLTEKDIAPFFKKATDKFPLKDWKLFERRRKHMRRTETVKKIMLKL